MAKKPDPAEAVDVPTSPATTVPTVEPLKEIPPGTPIEGLPVEEVAPLVPLVSEEPANSEYRGLYSRRGETERFALAVRPDARDNRTHFLKNNIHFINITEADFRLQFDEVK